MHRFIGLSFAKLCSLQLQAIFMVEPPQDRIIHNHVVVWNLMPMFVWRGGVTGKYV
jgi:hypothetical protein